MWIKSSLLGIWWVQSFSEYFWKLLWWWRLPISRYWNVKMQWYQLLPKIWINQQGNQSTFWNFHSLHLLSRKYPNCLESLCSFVHNFFLSKVMLYLILYFLSSYHFCESTYEIDIKCIAHSKYFYTEKEIQSRKFSAMISKNKRGCRE